MDITFEFATRDDCLDQMVPSDLRALVAERDALKKLSIDLMNILPGYGKCGDVPFERKVLEDAFNILGKDALEIHNGPIRPSSEED